MATQTTVTISCDICGSITGAATRAIALDGRALEIDLCGKDARGLDKIAAKYVPAARRITASRLSASAGRRTISDRERSADVRAWAKSQGFGVSNRGRIPANVERDYDAVH